MMHTGNSAQFQRLIDQRQEYEELMQELFTMYRTETITAPCDGIVTGVDEDGAYLLADDGEGWFVNLLSFFEKERNTGFMAYAVMITDAAEGKTTLMIDPEAVYIADMAGLNGISATLFSMAQRLDYIGNVPIYTQDSKGLLHYAGIAKTGDILLAVGDDEQVCWFVKLDGSNEPAQATQVENKSGRIELSLLSNEGTGDQGGDDQGDGDQVDDDQDNGDQDSDDQSDGDQDDGDQDHGDQGGGDQGDGDQDDGDQDDGEQDDGDRGDGDQGDGEQDDGDQGDGDQGGGDQGDGDQGDGDQDDDQTTESAIFTGYVAQLVEIKDGWAKVKQTLYSYTITDLSSLPKVSASATDLTVEQEYTSELIKPSELAVGDTFLIVVDNKGTVRLVSKEAVQEFQGTPGQQGGTNTDGTPSGGMSAGGGMTGGMGQVQTFETYSLDKLTVASVTSQEHMTVPITVDELDITKIYVGQAAMVSVDALGGEQFEAEITKVSNSGVNEGGNSKFTVEVTLSKSGEMLPGMYSSAFITLETCENVPCVPVAALGKDGVDSILYTSYDAETGTLGDPVVVSIGVSDGENVQIMEGFAAGETCYYEYYDTYVGSDTPQKQGRSFDLARMLSGR